MLGVGQANRVLQFIAIVKGNGGVERKDMKTLNSACYTNPFNTTGDGAPFIYITRRGDIKFGSTLTGASALSEERVTRVMDRYGNKQAV